VNTSATIMRIGLTMDWAKTREEVGKGTEMTPLQRFNCAPRAWAAPPLSVVSCHLKESFSEAIPSSIAEHPIPPHTASVREAWRRRLCHRARKLGVRGQGFRSRNERGDSTRAVWFLFTKEPNSILIGRGFGDPQVPLRRTFFVWVGKNPSLGSRFFS
jgi:hypothetical protein